MWLLLHFGDLTAPYSSYSDLMKNSSFKTELNKLGITKYNKADKQLFDFISDNILIAKQRAEKMNTATLKSSYEKEDNPHLLNPYTNVHKLLDAIDDFAKN